MKNQSPSNQEDVLIALDQLDQTLEVMSGLVARLKHSLQPTETPEAITTTLDELEMALTNLDSCH